MKMGEIHKKILKRFIFFGVLAVIVLMPATAVRAEEECPFTIYDPESDKYAQDVNFFSTCVGKSSDKDFNEKCGNRCEQGCKNLYTQHPETFCGSCYQWALTSITTKKNVTAESLYLSGETIPELDEVEQFCNGHEQGRTAVQEVKKANCPHGPLGCCKSIHVKGVGGKGQIEKEQCPGQQPVFYGECFCEVEGIISPNQGVKDYKDCEKKCTEMGGKVNIQGIGKYKNLYEAASLSSTQQQFINALCFTREECASEEYGGSSDAIRESGECLGGKVKCRAPEPDLELSSPILGVTTIKGLRQYLELLFRFAMGIVALTAAVAFIWGGFKYIVGSSAGDITSAKNSMLNAVVGLLLATSAVMILNTINPAATRLSRLEVWLINRMLYTEDMFCQDYEAIGGKEPSFADPGEPVGEVTYEQAESEGKFDLTKEKTICGREYYAKGYAGKTCFGMACEQGQACVACKGKSGIKECQESTRPFACTEAAMVINVNYTDGAVPLKLYLLGVCGWIQSVPNAKFDSDFVESQIPEIIEAGRFESGNDVVTFVVPPEQDKLQNLIKACEKNGNGNTLIGVLIGIAYMDANPDVLIMKKSECKPGVKIFSGYANGTATTLAAEAVGQAGSQGAGSLGGAVSSYIAQGILGSSVDDMKTAVYCGYRMVPGSRQASKWREHNFDNTPGVYWETTELDRAFSGTEPITCNTLLDKKNAPPDPGDLYMSKCRSGWCMAEDDEATCKTTIAPMFQ